MDLVKKLNPFKRHRVQTQDEMPVLTSTNHHHGNHHHHHNHHHNHHHHGSQPSSSQRDSSSKKKAATEKELVNLNHKIEKLLANLDDSQSEKNFAEDEECVVCLSSRATMKTYPCGHRVVCRKCFVKTIQTAVSERCLPLKCVVCRTKILKLKQKSEERKSRKQSHSNHQQQHNHTNNNGYNKRSIYSLPSPYQTIAIASRKHHNLLRPTDPQSTPVLTTAGVFSTTTPTISLQTSNGFTPSSFSRSNSSCAGHQDSSCASSTFNGSSSNPGTSSRFSSKPSLAQTPSMASSGMTTPKSGCDIQMIRIPPPPPVNRRRGAEKRSLSSVSTKNVLRISEDFGHDGTPISVDVDSKMTPESSSFLVSNKNHFLFLNGSPKFPEQSNSRKSDVLAAVSGPSDSTNKINNNNNNNNLHNYTYTINLNNFPVSGSYDNNASTSNNNNHNNNNNNVAINKCNICQEQAKLEPPSANKISVQQRLGACIHHQQSTATPPPLVSKPNPVPKLMHPLLIYPAEATVPARDKKWPGISGWSEDVASGSFVSTPPSVFKVFSGKRKTRLSNLYAVD